MVAPELTSRERVRLALEHRQTDRVPIALVCSGINEPARTQFDALLRCERGIGLHQYLNDILDIQPADVPYAGPPLAPGTDIWGVGRRPVCYGDGTYDEIIQYPLAQANDVRDLDKHQWPTPRFYDYGVLPERIAAARSDRNHCLMLANGNIFETSWYMRGFERIFMDMVMNPELVHAIMGRVADFLVEHFTRALAAANGEIGLVFTADDIGGQQGLLISLDMWQEFIKPCHVRLNKAIHSFGAKVIYHSDGGIMQAVFGLIDMGIDVLQALQFDAAGMDPAILKQRYGHRLCFQGGASVQRTLPFGSAEQVQDEVRHLISVLGRGGGYIFGPSHAIHAGTPPENVLAMFETALHWGPAR